MSANNNNNHNKNPIDHQMVSVFATPTALESLEPHLILPARQLSAEQFTANVPFFMAVLNFYYFVLCVPGLAERLDLDGVVDGEGWMRDLESGVREFGAEGGGGGGGAEEGGQGLDELGLLEGVIAMCREKMEEMEERRLSCAQS